MNESYDAVVIGAGVFGAWTAWHLQRAGQRVLLIDKYGPASARASSGGTTRVIRMAYGDRPPRVSTRDAREPKKAAKKILAHKKDNWAYEREWRVLGDCGRVEYGSQNCVSRIYLGARITSEHRRTLVQELRGCDLKFFEMVEVQGYGHKFVRFDP